MQIQYGGVTSWLQRQSGLAEVKVVASCTWNRRARPFWFQRELMWWLLVSWCCANNNAMKTMNCWILKWIDRWFHFQAIIFKGVTTHSSYWLRRHLHCCCFIVSLVLELMKNRFTFYVRKTCVWVKILMERRGIWHFDWSRWRCKRGSYHEIFELFC